MLDPLTSRGPWTCRKWRWAAKRGVLLHFRQEPLLISYTHQCFNKRSYEDSSLFNFLVPHVCSDRFATCGFLDELSCNMTVSRWKCFLEKLLCIVLLSVQIIMVGISHALSNKKGMSVENICMVIFFTNDKNFCKQLFKKSGSQKITEKRKGKKKIL